MAVYIYKGLRSDGKPSDGEITATSVAEAKAQLRSKKINVLSLKRKDSIYNKIKEIQFGTGVGTREKAAFTRQFATMINAGLPLMKCLDILTEQETNPGFKKVLLQLSRDVEGGTTLAEAMRKHTSYFNNLYVNMVEAGEKGGALDTILQRLATYLEKAAALMAKIRGAMIYPTMISIVTVLAVAVILMFVLPTFKTMFEGLGADLPLPTQIVMMLSNVLRGNFFIIIGVVVLLVIGYNMAIRTKKGLLIKDKIALYVPVFGPLTRKSSIKRARWSRQARQRFCWPKEYSNVVIQSVTRWVQHSKTAVGGWMA